MVVIALKDFIINNKMIVGNADNFAKNVRMSSSVQSVKFNTILMKMEAARSVTKNVLNVQILIIVLDALMKMPKVKIVFVNRSSVFQTAVKCVNLVELNARLASILIMMIAKLV